MKGNMDSKPQQKVGGINLASFLKPMSQNCEISQTSSSFVAVEDDAVALRKFRSEGEEEGDSVVVSDTEEVQGCSADTGATREFETEVFVENVTELPCLLNTSLGRISTMGCASNQLKLYAKLHLMVH